MLVSYIRDGKDKVRYIRGDRKSYIRGRKNKVTSGMGKDKVTSEEDKD